MHVEKFNYNIPDDLAANTYVVDDDKGHALVIDPSMDYDGVINYLENHHLSLVAILLTHAHFDHIRGIKRLIDKYHVKVYLHHLEEETLHDSRLNCSYGFAKEEVEIHPEVVLISDNDELRLLDNEVIKVIHTPYHTSGSVCYYFINNKWLFSGDTLFRLTVGRCDLPTSSPSSKESSFRKLRSLDRDTKIFPGHGNNSTIEYELQFNRLLNR